MSPVPPTLSSSVSAVRAEVGICWHQEHWRSDLAGPARAPLPRVSGGAGGRWGLSRLNLWFEEEPTPIHSRVWFERGTQHVTCSVQPGGPWGGPWGGPSCMAVPATPPLSRSSLGAGPGSEPAAVSVRRSQRHQAGPAATSPADDAISVPQVVLIHSSSDSTSSCSRVQCK